MAADTWRTVRELAVFYFVRRNWAVTVLASYRTHVTDADLRALAATVGVRDPAFFLGCPRTPAAANCPERPSPGDRRFHRGASGYPR